MVKCRKDLLSRKWAGQLTVSHLSLCVGAQDAEGLSQRHPLLELLWVTLAVQGREEHDEVEAQRLPVSAPVHTAWREGKRHWTHAVCTSVCARCEYAGAQGGVSVIIDSSKVFVQCHSWANDTYSIIMHLLFFYSKIAFLLLVFFPNIMSNWKYILIIMTINIYMYFIA